MDTEEVQSGPNTSSRLLTAHSRVPLRQCVMPDTRGCALPRPRQRTAVMIWSQSISSTDSRFLHLCTSVLKNSMSLTTRTIFGTGNLCLHLAYVIICCDRDVELPFPSFTCISCLPLVDSPLSTSSSTGSQLGAFRSHLRVRKAVLHRGASALVSGSTVLGLIAIAIFDIYSRCSVRRHLVWSSRGSSSIFGVSRADPTFRD